MTTCGHVAGREAAERELRDDALRLALQRLLLGKRAAHVLEVVAGVEQEEPVVVLDEHRVDGEAQAHAAVDVPQELRPVDHHRAAVEEEDSHSKSTLTFLVWV